MERKKKTAEERLLEKIEEIAAEERKKKVEEGLESYKKFKEKNPEVVEEWVREWLEIERELREQEEDIWEGLEEEEEEILVLWLDNKGVKFTKKLTEGNKEEEEEEEDEEDITDEEFRIGLANSLSNLFKTPEEIEENKDMSVHNITLTIMGIDDEVFERIQDRVDEVIEEVIEEYYDEEGNKRTEEELEEEDEEELLGYEDDYEYDNDEVVEEEVLDNKETKREWVEITEDGKEVRVEEVITKTRSRRYLY